jgi:hypothetical protein
LSLSDLTSILRSFSHDARVTNIMQNRFFKKAARKAVRQGLVAWGMFQVVHLIEASSEKSTMPMAYAAKIMMHYFGIPGLATVGYELFMQDTFGIERDMESAAVNAGVTIFSALTSNRNINVEFAMPLTLYVMALVYNYFCSENDESELALAREMPRAGML